MTDIPAYAIFFLFLLASISCTDTLEDKVKTYEIAHNSHDIDKVMSLYTDDISFEIVGAWTRSGKDRVRGIAEWDLATNSEMNISDIEINDNIVSFKLKEGNDWFRSIGIDHMYYDPCQMVFEDGLIKELKAEVTEESGRAFNEAWPPVYKWLSEEKSEELSKLLTPKGEFIYDQENAKIWLNLLREWESVQ